MNCFDRDKVEIIEVEGKGSKIIVTRIEITIKIWGPEIEYKKGR